MVQFLVSCRGFTEKNPFASTLCPKANSRNPTKNLSVLSEILDTIAVNQVKKNDISV